MKKLLLSVLMVAAFLTALMCGCNNENAELKKRLAELEESNVNLAERIEELERENGRLWDTLYELGVQDGEFYTLQQAYDYGWLTQDDLKSIAYYHNGGTEYNEEIMGEDYQPQPKTPEVLDKTVVRSIKYCYIDEFLTNTNAKKSDVYIDNYYGSYNGCIPLMMSDNYSGTTGVESRQTVGDIEFYYNSGNEIKIWRQLN